MKTTTIVTMAVLGAVGLAVLPDLSSAQTAPARGENLLLMWDADSDGTVTLAEVQTRRGDIFTAFDAHGDDQLTPEEMATLEEMRSLQQEEMGAYAGNGKGHGQGQGKGKAGQTIDRASFVAQSESWHARKDSNGDGVLTVADFAG